MQQDFYTVEGLATQLLSSAFINLNNIPDYRLRPMLRILPSLSQASWGEASSMSTGSLVASQRRFKCCVSSLSALCRCVCEALGTLLPSRIL